MRQRVVHYMDIWAILCAIFALVYTIAFFFPTSYWLSINKVFVGNTPVNTPVLIAFDRSINRDFRGKYSVAVVDMETLLPTCWASAIVPYKKTPRHVKTVTLKWWGYGIPNPCDGEKLAAGHYQMTTTWVIKGLPWFVPTKSVSVTSNIFEVLEGSRIRTQ